MSNQKNEFENEDPLDRVSGSISGTSEFIPESTMIPESGMVMLPDEPGADDGPTVVGDGDGKDEPISDSIFSDSVELPKKGESSAIKKNLPMIVFGVVAVGVLGFAGMKFMGQGNGATQAQAAPKAVPAQVTKISEDKTTPKAQATEPSVIAAAPAILSNDSGVASGVSLGASEPALSQDEDLYKTTAFTPEKPIQSNAATQTNDSKPVALDGTIDDKGGILAKDTVNSCAPVQVQACGVNQAKKSEKKYNKTTQKKVVVAKRVKKEQAPLPSTAGYEVHLSANGLAWIQLPGGEKRIVQKGDLIEGLGTVKEIDHRKNMIKVGRVTLK